MFVCYLFCLFVLFIYVVLFCLFSAVGFDLRISPRVSFKVTTENVNRKFGDVPKSFASLY